MKTFMVLFKYYAPIDNGCVELNLRRDESARNLYSLNQVGKQARSYVLGDQMKNETNHEKSSAWKDNTLILL